MYPYILGDAAYGLHVNLMKGCTGTMLSLEEEWFCYKLSSARMVVERSFGRLKGRWRILQGASQFKRILSMCRMVASCWVLHNICEAAGEPYKKQWEAAMTKEWKKKFEGVSDETDLT